jgi:hypothetical protein
MGTKLNPGRYDCHAAAKPDEPLFTLLARDKHFACVVGFWAVLRAQEVAEGADMDKVMEALTVAREGAAWRAANEGDV